MSYFLFIDESGQDHRESPYEVLAGVAIKNTDLWRLVQDIQQAEIRIFGRRYSSGNRELKATKILKKKVFKHACQSVEIPPRERARLAKECLEGGDDAGAMQLKALAAAKIDYVHELFRICGRYNCKIFASIINADGPEPHACDYLRKDYSFLFERFYYFLEDQRASSGIVVFDELDKSKSHILLGQMDGYFKTTTKGRQRANLIIPEPFFVHSDLSTGVQIADLIAYCLSWGFRTGTLIKPLREEIEPFVRQINRLRHRTFREVNGNPRFEIWSVAIINSLRLAGDDSAEGA